MAAQFNRKTRVRLSIVLKRADPWENLHLFTDSNRALVRRHVEGLPQTLLSGAIEMVQAGAGEDLSKRVDASSIEEMCERADDELLALFMRGCWHHLRRQEHFERTIPLSPAEFEEAINQTVAAGGYPSRLRDGAWVPTVVSDADALYRALLSNADDAAEFKQGDIQIEMVVSTVQERLSRPGVVLVDYGVGLGRVLLGLASAGLFKNATYVAVDRPIHDDVKALAGKVGAQAEFHDREAFLASSQLTADVIMVVNTLHHIPFSELARQLAALLAKLKPEGVLLVHEMAELREPEQLNVPWRVEDVHLLFNTPLLKPNLRTTQSKGQKVPITHLLVKVAGDGDLSGALEANARAVWDQMKARTLDTIRELYQRKDPEAYRELQYALIANANLDLNKP
ncbi:methyltransferase domain-containing protein [Myxococcus sp. AM011]|uniref:methyltransferase domain-containing protein n=1 Tax=Myxococcus sp. AM011 TaxID=2745200 RepID=UPI0015953014|nr:methyltransferase domain-containing protein [Myxococcus sp. AM011]NVJ27776.1 methyltransferase domain-containing protein [Myxococcus sp. AM011]